ncbi:Uncharacterised protein [Yersinia frederiksenii]|nr:Uncharacterised protein [Yersinia frederiksenii]
MGFGDTVAVHTHVDGKQAVFPWASPIESKVGGNTVLIIGRHGQAFSHRLEKRGAILLITRRKDNDIGIEGLLALIKMMLGD